MEYSYRSKKENSGGSVFRKLMLVALAFVAVFFITSNVSEAATGLIQDEATGRLRYIDPVTSEAFQDKYKTVDGKTYFFDENGLSVSGLIVNDKGDLSYYDTVDYSQYKNRWKTVDGKTYLFNANGCAIKGLYENPQSKDLYYFDPVDYSQYKDRWKTVNGKTYLFNIHGVARKGKFTNPQNGDIYFFDLQTAEQYKDRWKTVDGKTYLFNIHGVAREGLFQNPNNGDIYYFEPGTAVQYKNRWKTVAGSSYYFNANGCALKGLTRIVDGGDAYYFDANGVQWKKGWFEWNGISYYSNANGVVLNPPGMSGDRIQTIEGVAYQFNSDGSVRHETVLSTNASMQKIVDRMQAMTLDERIRQMMLVHYPEGNTVGQLSDTRWGGYILFSAHFKNETTSSIQGAISRMQNAAENKLFFAVDEEGGTVTRISRYSQYGHSQFRSPQRLYAAGGFDLIRSDTIEKARFLKNLGLNYNLAPVADVSTSSSDYIYARSFGKNATETSKYVSTVVEAMLEERIGQSMKHFPGYGATEADPHHGSSVDNRSMSQVLDGMRPFVAGIEKGASSIMVSQVTINAFDKTKPSSISKPIHDYIRDTLGYRGVLLTDDLSMGAISDYFPNAAAMAVEAGNDMLITTNPEQAVRQIKADLANGKLSELEIERAVIRILAMKESLGIL